MNGSKPDSSFVVDRLRVEVHQNRRVMGAAACAAVADRLRRLLALQASVRIVFAAAPSQNEFLAALTEAPGIDWSRIEAFHMDEYLGLPGESPQSFGAYLRDHIFAPVKPGIVHYLNGNARSPVEECHRYARLLRERPVDIVCMGIGENGHIAFNDPPVADFADPETVKVVTLEERCRLQQVHDGCFKNLDAVPTRALSLTVPALMSGRAIYCLVPGQTKSEAVLRTLRNEISTACPATILRTHTRAELYLDPDSAALLGPAGKNG